MTFPPDQVRTPDRQRSGAHRPRRSPLVEVLPAVLVLLAVLGVGVGVWQLDRSTAGTVAASGGPADAEGRAADATTSPSPTLGGSPTPTGPATAAPTPEPTATSPTGVVDRSTPVSVLNATSRSGLAGRAAGTLRATGWSVTTGNERTRQPPTTVFYAASDQQATAQAVADDVGGTPAVEQSSQFGTERVTVVLGDDYAG